MPESAQPSSNPQTILLFARGVLALLDLWPALAIAVNEQWGGPESAEKKTWLASTIIDEFETHANYLSSSTSTACDRHIDPSTAIRPPLDHDDLADLLNQMMSDEFEANIEDGSIEAVTADILRLWRDLFSAAPEAIVEALERKAAEVKRSGVQATQAGDLIEVEDEDDGESGSEEEDMEIDEAPKLVARHKEEKPEPVVDEDGFTLVQGIGRRR
ncbi:MAG: hypothetical protein TREMPRED_004271 [Tremellales sp. Tagirdzhanova-0007]|nr:MAG: hypothetical protein TREMPRED_004271 [Tremellales sp. Tagirdzhanova-0007]